MNKLLVVTANGGADLSAISMLQNSCSFYELDFDWYGENDPWEGMMISKLGGLIKYLKTAKHEFVLFADGWDSWMLSDEETVLRKFRQFKKPVVTAGHTECYPLVEYAKYFKDVDTRFKYICSGQFMGRRKELLEMCIKVKNNYNGYSDQGGWSKAHAEGIIDVEIDHKCKLFVTMSLFSLRDVYFRKGKLFFRETRTCPVNIHFGGPKGGAPNAVNMRNLYARWLRKR